MLAPAAGTVYSHRGDESAQPRPVAAAAGSEAHGPRELLADRVSAALSAGTAFLVLALAVILLARPRATSSSVERGGEASPHPAPDQAAAA